ncbi:MAG: DUF2288 domain-containing protein [Porticoccaceae bacterium]|nr:DUF2288 domain-containing protein [Porticoccaceae bacterium]
MPGQSSENLTDNDLLRAKINLETSRINWLDLQTFFARGQVVQVSSALDLVEVALSLNHDDKQAFEQWLKDGSVSYVTDSLAQQWFESKKELWSVVVAPWVIVQDKD